MNVLGTIPARADSKSIPDKNMVELGGTSLVNHTIGAGRVSQCSRIIITTDIEVLVAVWRNEWDRTQSIKRPQRLCGDDTPMIDVMKHAVQSQLEHYDIIVLLQPTSPFRTAQHIDDCIDLLIESQADSVVSVCELPHNCDPTGIFAWNGNGSLPSFRPVEPSRVSFRTRRQDKPKLYVRNGPAVLAVTYDCLMRKNSLYGEKCLPYVMSKLDSIDIDDEDDLELARALIAFRSIIPRQL